MRDDDNNDEPESREDEKSTSSQARINIPKVDRNIGQVKNHGQFQTTAAPKSGTVDSPNQSLNIAAPELAATARVTAAVTLLRRSRRKGCILGASVDEGQDSRGKVVGPVMETQGLDRWNPC